MKIEKISENQLKIFLSQNDLKERNIKLTELAYGSEKTQALFREMMIQAMSSCGFEFEDTPLMIEATPVSSDGVVIMVSKVTDENAIDNKFTLMPPSKEERKFVRKDIKRDFFGEGLFERRCDEEEIVIIYSFDKIDDITAVSHKISNVYNGTNCLYRYKEKYFLVAQNDNQDDNIDIDTLEIIFSEYGNKHTSNLISKYFLEEHAEIIVKNDVLKTFASYL